MNATLTDQPFFFSTSMMSTAGIAPLSPPNPSSSTGEDLVQRARREIAEIVREVAALARQPLDRLSFFAALIDRTVCAIAAEGAVIWDCQHESPIVVVKTGRVTDTAIQPASLATHARLLREITSSQSPAVVPATPGATDPHLPNNPTQFPAAIVPILDLANADTVASSGTPKYVLEVFLENEAGVATQRGYLRFTVQMSDLASEFLRADELRLSRRRATLHSQMMNSLDRIHRLETSAAVAAEIVDATAEMFAVARVSLVSLGGRPRLLAVSHVETMDRRGEACRQLVQQLTAFQFAAGSHQLSKFETSDTSDSSAEHDVELHPFAITKDSADQLRMLLQDHRDRLPDQMAITALDDWSRQSLAILANRLRLESVPLARAYLAIAPRVLLVSPSSSRRLLTAIGAMITVVMIAFIPTPMWVTMPATLRPDGTRIHYAPSDATVESVEVSHGQNIKPGDVLIRLRDWSLEEQITTLVARRGLVSQRLARSIASLVESPVSAPYPHAERASTSDEELVQEQRLLEEEIAGLDEQIELLAAARDRLTIRADREGRVDAWQAELTATGRPVRRGDALVRVEPQAAKWKADAQIDQSRIGIVVDRFRVEPNAQVKVATVARPDQLLSATFTRREIAVQSNRERLSSMIADGGGSLGIEFTIDRNADDQHVGSIDEAWTNGAPATVTIDCGKRPLAEVMFFDLVRAARRTWVRWI